MIVESVIFEISVVIMESDKSTAVNDSKQASFCEARPVTFGAVPLRVPRVAWVTTVSGVDVRWRGMGGGRKS